MSTSYVDIKAAIKAKLDTISGIASITTNSTGDYSEYPAAQLYGTTGESLQRQNVRRLYTYRYRLDVFIEQGSNFSAAKAERIALEIVDEIITTFNADVTLGGSVLEVRPLGWSLDFEARELDMRLLTMEFEALKLETTTG